MKIDTLVDIRLVECLLVSIAATLESFTIALANTYMDAYLGQWPLVCFLP